MDNRNLFQTWPLEPYYHRQAGLLSSFRFSSTQHSHGPNCSMHYEGKEESSPAYRKRAMCRCCWAAAWEAAQVARRMQACVMQEELQSLFRHTEEAYRASRFIAQTQGRAGSTSPTPHTPPLHAVHVLALRSPA